MERLDVDVLIAREVLRIERQNLFDAILPHNGNQTGVM
jgi:hypothetical protein